MENLEGSKMDIRSTPDFPAKRPRHMASTPTPSGVKAPIPVMAISNAKGGYPVRRIVNATGRIADRRETLLNPTALNYINGAFSPGRLRGRASAYTLVS